MTETAGLAPRASSPVAWPMASELPPLGALPTAPRVVRAHVRALLALWGLAGLGEAAEAVVSELVANAVEASSLPDGSPRYGTGGRLLQVALRLRTDGARLRIEVFDQAPGLPAPRGAGTWAESGRGLALVDFWTRGRWGHLERNRLGWKLVFAELAWPLPDAVARLRAGQMAGDMTDLTGRDFT